MTKPLILASGSAYRKALLSRLGVGFDCVLPDIDESPLAGESFRQTAQRLAKEKALAVAREHPMAVVIGSDQVAHCGDMRLDKPGGADRAFAQLMLQRGNVSQFHTAVCVATDGGLTTFEAMVTTDVRFKDATELTEAAIRDYIAKEQPFDCAGAAKSEGLGIALMASMDGPDPTALIGLPLIALTQLLPRAGITVLAG
jgi:septum formation protein